VEQGTAAEMVPRLFGVRKPLVAVGDSEDGAGAAASRSMA
jgi:ATP-binding cassette subfamily C protein LapB